MQPTNHVPRNEKEKKPDTDTQQSHEAAPSDRHVTQGKNIAGVEYEEAIHTINRYKRKRLVSTLNQFHHVI
jgi:hypothetical protein